MCHLQMPFVHPGFSQTSHVRPSTYGISMRPRYLPAIIDVIKFYSWRGIIYLYDSYDGKCTQTLIHILSFLSSLFFPLLSLSLSLFSSFLTMCTERKLAC